MMAVRLGMYKAHYWTWSNSLEEFEKVCLCRHLSFCLYEIAYCYQLQVTMTLKFGKFVHVST